MAKESQNRSEDPTVARPRSAAGLHGQSANWEKRLHEARLQREKFLAVQSAEAKAGPDRGDTEPGNAAPNAEAREPAAPPVDPKEKSDRRPEEPPVRRSLRAGSTASRVVLAFATAAGFGFGIVLGLGALLGTGEMPVRNAVLVSDDTDGGPVADAVADTFAFGTPSLADDVISTAVLSRAPKAAPDRPLEVGPAFLDISSVALISPATGDPRLDLPAVAPVGMAAAESRRTSPAPVLSARDDISGLAVAAGAEGDAAHKLQFFMHAPNGVPDAKLQGYVAQLDTSGVKIAEIGRESFRVSATHLRFYSPENADVAQSVAASLGVEARDFSANRIDADRIEIWIAGRPRARAANTAAPDRSSRTAQLRKRLSSNR